MPALFSLIEQDLAQRFFAARTQRIATLSALCSCIFLILFALIPIYFGMQAKLLGVIVPAGISPLIPTIELLTNELMVIFCLCAIIAAITSTADSLLCAISSNAAQDFEVPLMGNALTQSKLITLIVGIGALAASYFVPQNIITILIDSYAISVSCLLVPLTWAYFKETVSKKAAVISIISGLIAFIIMPLWQTNMPTVLIPVIVSAIGYMIGDRLDKKNINKSSE
jgi:SSS family solute:Na+ symporter